MSKSRETPGTQTAQRALRVLKLIGAFHAEGLTAKQVVMALGENRSAIQRSLLVLESEGLIQRGADHHRYHLGLEAAQLGRASYQHSPLVEHYRFELQKIARQTGDTVFLSVRLGDFILCVFRDEGSSSVRVPRTRVGDVRVMGTTAGGLAMLARLDDAQIRALYERHEPAFQLAQIDAGALARHITLARRCGYTLISDNISQGVTSVGVCLDTPGAPLASAAIATHTAKMTDERVQELLGLLRGLKATLPSA